MQSSGGWNTAYVEGQSDFYFDARLVEGHLRRPPSHTGLVFWVRTKDPPRFNPSSAPYQLDDLGNVANISVLQFPHWKMRI